MGVRDNLIRLKFCQCLLLIGSIGNMSSNSRITHSKGPVDDVSLPPCTRSRKETNTEAGKKESMTQHNAEGQTSWLGNSVEQTSPFARPGSRAGASPVPAIMTEVPGHLTAHS